MKQFDNGNVRLCIFPTIVYVVQCSDLVEDVKVLLSDDVEWSDSPIHGQTNDLYILTNRNPELVKKFEDKVNEVLVELNFENTFQMTTSWFTRIAPYGHIESHHHTNCIWSSSFYFNDNCGHITFMKNAYGVHVPQDCSDPDLGMSGDINFPCEKGKLILFPSQLKHKVVSNQSDDIRYSMAMNFVPDGEVKCGDSSFNYG